MLKGRRERMGGRGSGLRAPCRLRYAEALQAAVQDALLPEGVNGRPQTGQAIVTPSARDGDWLMGFAGPL
jgi:hypothetical protein